MKIEKISAVTFRVASMRDSVRFYRDVLGMELLHGGDGLGGVAKTGRNLGQFRAEPAPDRRRLGSAPDENGFTMSRTGGMGVQIAAAFEVKKETPA